MSASRKTVLIMDPDRVLTRAMRSEIKRRIADIRATYTPPPPTPGRLGGFDMFGVLNAIERGQLPYTMVYRLRLI